MGAMNAWMSWGLAALALIGGYLGFGPQGLVLGLTVIVFWLLLQWSRALRVLKQAARAPVGRVPSAVMFNARLHSGMTLAEVLKCSGSLGTQVSAAPEAWAWADGSDSQVTVNFVDGRVSQWTLSRPDTPPGS
jgi:hypothetical protein